MAIRSSRAFYSFEETRLKLEISEDELIKLAAQGTLHAIGRSSKFACEEIMAYLQNRHAAPSDENRGAELEAAIDPVQESAAKAETALTAENAGGIDEPIDIVLDDIDLDGVSIENERDEISTEPKRPAPPPAENPEANFATADTAALKKNRAKIAKSDDISVKIAPKNDDTIDETAEIALEDLPTAPPITASPAAVKSQAKAAPLGAANPDVKGTTVSQQKDQSDNLEPIDLGDEEIESQPATAEVSADIDALPALEELDPDEIGITIDDVQETTQVDDVNDKMDLTLREYNADHDKPAERKQAHYEAPSEEDIKKNSRPKSARVEKAEPKKASARKQAAKKSEPEPTPEDEIIEEFVDEPEESFTPLAAIPQRQMVIVPPKIGDLESPAWRGLLIALVLLMLYPAFLLGFNTFFDVTDSQAAIPVGAQKFTETRRPGEKPLLNVGDPYVPSMFSWIFSQRLYDNKLIYEYFGTRKTEPGGERGFDKFVKYEDRVRQGQVKNLPKEIEIVEAPEPATTSVETTPVDDDALDGDETTTDTDDYIEGLF